MPAALIGDLGSVRFEMWTGVKVLATSVLFGSAFLLMTLSFRLVEPRLVAPFRYTALLWGLLLSGLVFGETLTVEKMVGTGLIVLGIAWVLSMDGT